jgi:alpha-soluble NSF attachment protein
VLCCLAKGDAVAAGRKLEQYKELDYTLAGSRECKLAEDIVRTFDEFNPDEFTDVVYAYDQISKLDPWKTTILLRIKTKISDASKEAVDLS